MRRTLTPLFIILAFLVLAGTTANRVLEYRSIVVTVASEKGEKQFHPGGLIVPLWKTHRDWNAPAKPGQPREWAHIDVQNGFFARPGYSVLGAVTAGLIFPLLLVSVALFWAYLLFRTRASARSVSK